MLLHSKNLTHSSSLFVDINHITSPIDSTQDEARRRLVSHNTTERALAILADVQLHGRGTSGRKWERGSDDASDGNLYLTVCLPMAKIPVTITLLPIHVAVVVATLIQTVLLESDATSSQHTFNSLPPMEDLHTDVPSQPTVQVKWPNDVLINDRKVSGTLIENEIVEGETWLLVGIGINVASHPDLRHVRPATSIAEWTDTPILASVLGHQIAVALSEWVYQPNNNEASERKLLAAWRALAQLGTDYKIRDTGEIVKIQDIEVDGSLRVIGQDGKLRSLVADYLQ